MLDKIMTLLVGLLIALGGWSLSRTFELSTVQAVQEDKVNRLERHVDKLQNHIENMMKRLKVKAMNLISLKIRNRIGKNL